MEVFAMCVAICQFLLLIPAKHPGKRELRQETIFQGIMQDVKQPQDLTLPKCSACGSDTIKSVYAFHDHVYKILAMRRHLTGRHPSSVEIDSWMAPLAQSQSPGTCVVVLFAWQFLMVPDCQIVFENISMVQAGCETTALDFPKAATSTLR